MEVKFIMNGQLSKTFWITIITLIVVHIILLILGAFIGTNTGFWGLSMLWPHWHSLGKAIVSIIATIILFFIIYLFVNSKSNSN